MRWSGATPPSRLRTGVTEVDAIAEQLSAAAGLARARELDLAVREHRARAIAQVAHALNASGSLDTVLRTAVEAVRGLVDADRARIALVDDMGRLVLRFSTDVSSAMPPGFVIEPGHGIGGVAWQTGRPARTDDFAADPRFREDRYLPIVRADGIVSAMAVPVVTAGTVVGIIYANRLSRRPFTAADEAALMTLADHAAVAVQQATPPRPRACGPRGRGGGEPREGRVPGHARPRAAQPAGRRSANAVAGAERETGACRAASGRAREIINRQVRHLAAPRRRSARRGARHLGQDRAARAARRSGAGGRSGAWPRSGDRRAPRTS